ncbi:MAG: D-lactate dehydrogenase (cytochrome), partial [Bacteroidetes bacterium]|nr:D-lactate dehydrogenase (cytochrome) [Bacteroidota bacterium]
MLTGPYAAFSKSISTTIPPSQLIDDELRTLTYGTDASLYRLIPKLVVKVQTEEEVITVLREARRYRLPVTFRAAGTSLSGQAISDSVLVLLGEKWNRW